MKLHHLKIGMKVRIVSKTNPLGDDVFAKSDPFWTDWDLPRKQGYGYVQGFYENNIIGISASKNLTHAGSYSLCDIRPFQEQLNLFKDLK